MTNQLRIGVLLIAILLSTFSGNSQERLRFTETETESLSLPFQVSQNLIILTLSINGSEPMNFVLDSGINNTIITEMTGVDTIQLHFAREVKLAGLGSGNAGTAFSSTGNTILLSQPNHTRQGIIGTDHQVYILKEDLFSLSKQLGMQVNGLIGVEFFNSFIIEIDHQAKIITFHNPETFKYTRRFRKYVEIPLQMIGSKAFVEARITQSGNPSTSVLLLIDSGASLPLWLAAHTNSQITIPTRTIPALLGQGLNGLIDGVNGRVDEFGLGSFTFENTLVSFPDSASVVGLIENTGRNGSLGNEILRRFNLVFDYPGNKLLLKPNRYLNDPFSYNKSGMEVEQPYVNLPMFVVFNTIPESPAAQAGILSGDQIMMINNLFTKKLKLDDINAILHGHQGNMVRLRISRNGESLKIKFRLSDELK